MIGAPVTCYGWAEYYACRPGSAALQLSFWYLFLSAYHKEDDMHTAG